jgi:hypothetical protein
MRIEQRQDCSHRVQVCGANGLSGTACQLIFACRVSSTLPSLQLFYYPGDECHTFFAAKYH